MLGSHANQTVSAFMASLDGDGVVYCNSSSLNFLLKKDVYQPLFTDKKYHPGLRRFSIPGVRVTYNDRIAAFAVIHAPNRDGQVITKFGSRDFEQAFL